MQLYISSLLALTVFSLSLVAEPGPPPREVRLDGDGDVLPPGALTRLGTKRFRDLMAHNMSVAPNGKSVACWGPNGVRIFDLPKGKLLHAWPTPELQTVRAVSSDGRFAVTTVDESIELWDVKAAKRLARRKVGLWPGNRAISVSADGLTVAYAGSPDLQGIHIWDVGMDRVRFLGEHKYDLNGLQLFEKNRVLAWTNSWETTCWDVPTGKRLWRAENCHDPRISGS